MLIYPTSHRQLDHIRPLRRANYPVVLLVGDPDAGIDAVCIDERRGAYKATRHLIDVGHRRIGIIDGANPLGNPEKLEGYQQALSEAGIDFDPVSASTRTATPPTGYWAMDTMMSGSKPSEAVFAANDSLAIGALQLVPDAQAARAGRHRHHRLRQYRICRIRLGTAVECQLCGRSRDPHGGRPADAADFGWRPSARAQVTQIDPDLVIRESTRARR